jgi:hypothetical protein
MPYCVVHGDLVYNLCEQNKGRLRSRLAALLIIRTSTRINRHVLVNATSSLKCAEE